MPNFIRTACGKAGRTTGGGRGSKIIPALALPVAFFGGVPVPDRPDELRRVGVSGDKKGFVRGRLVARSCPGVSTTTTTVPDG